MSVVDIILLTFAATVTLILIGLAIFFAARAVRRYLDSIKHAISENTLAVRFAAEPVRQVVQELAFMRTMTQQAAAASGQPIPETQPPVGRPGTMPSAFPVRPIETYVQVPDAKVDDTDHSLLKQTDEEMMEAQIREEARANGIEPVDESPQPAVGDEA